MLNTGQVVTPLVASITPNFEYNERSTVVILGYFGNRIALDSRARFIPWSSKWLTRAIRSSWSVQATSSHRRRG